MSSPVPVEGELHQVIWAIITGGVLALIGFKLIPKPIPYDRNEDDGNDWANNSSSEDEGRASDYEF